MKYTFLPLLLLLSPKTTFAQNEASNKYSIGFITKADYFKTDIYQNYLFNNTGITLGYKFTDKWEMNFNILYSYRGYDSVYIYDNSPVTLAEEQLLEIENHIRYRFFAHKSTPFFGAGYALQLPIKVNGSINFRNFSMENLNIPKDIKPEAKFGLHVLSGYEFRLGQKFRLNLGVGYKFFTNSNADIYQYGKNRLRNNFSARKDIDHSFLTSMAFIYHLKRK